ncbi:MAG: DUF4910 domain-containing protein [Acidobacteriota bacterium]
MRKNLFSFLFVIIFLFSSSFPFLTAQEIISKKIIDEFINELSGERAKDEVIMISRFHRIQASRGWHDAAIYIQNELKRYGIENISLEGWPSDGDTYYFTLQTPPGWEAKSAELWLVEPFQQKLCDYEENPNVLATLSRSANVKSELIDVGTGLNPEEYEGKDVKGKIVLATGYSGDVHREAVMKRGATGIVTYYPMEVRKEHPELVRYTSLRVRLSEKDKTRFAFNVSKSQGAMLKNLLQSGKKVVLHAKVDAEIYRGEVEVLTATIPGNVYPEKEVLIIAHLCHPKPSANDNASGSAGTLEIARTIKKLIDEKKINYPKRTIRFMWVPEMSGTIAYIKAHPEFQKNTIASINLDMIGENLEITDSTFNVTKTPDSMPTFLNDLVEYYTLLTDKLNITSLRGNNSPFNFRILPYSGGSDHYILTEGSISIPSVMFGHWPDPFHHTSQDTPDVTDPTELKRVCLITALSIWTIANAEDDEAIWMSHQIFKNGLLRIRENLNDGIRKLYLSKNSDELFLYYKQLYNILDHSFLREKSSILSTVQFTKNVESKNIIKNLIENLSSNETIFKKEIENLYQICCKKLNIKPPIISLTPEEKKASMIIPKRTEWWKGPLNISFLEDKLKEVNVREKIKLSGHAIYEASNFMDGKRSILEIYNAVSAEYGEQNLKYFEDFFNLLEKVNLIEYIKR